jgi:hypothetical protein
MGVIDKRGMLVEFDFVRRVFTEEGAVTALAEHYHRERNHQGKVDVLLFRAAEQRVRSREGKVRCKKRRGGLLEYYHREAA